jgi:hypothetical protein
MMASLTCTKKEALERHKTQQQHYKLLPPFLNYCCR